MKYVGLLLGLLLVSFLLISYLTYQTADKGLATLAPGERKALEALLTEAGIPADRIGLVAMTSLPSVAKSVSVEQGHVVGLRLSDIPLKRTDAVAGLSELKELWLSGNGLAEVRGLEALKKLERLDLSRNQLRQVSNLAGLPALQRLRLAHNQIESVAGLRDLPMLTELDLNDNQLADVAPLTALPALTTLDITENPLAELPSPTPARWKIKKDQTYPPTEFPAPPADRPSNWVAKEPSSRGHAQDVTTDGLVRSGPYKVVGTIRRLRGAHSAWNLKGDGSADSVNTTLEIEVKKGRVRAYLKYIPESGKALLPADGYIFAEAEPGNPAKIKGVLSSVSGGGDTATEYWLIIESRDGEAQGITFQLYR